MKGYPKNFPPKHREDIFRIWRAAGRKEWYFAYIFPEAGKNTGLMPTLKHAGFIIDEGRPMVSAPHLWRLSPWVCDICQQMAGEPSPEHIAKSRAYIEEKHRGIRQHRIGYNRNQKEQRKMRIKYDHRELITRIYQDFGTGEFTYYNLKERGYPVTSQTTKNLYAYRLVDKVRMQDHPNIWLWKLSPRSLAEVQP